MDPSYLRSMLLALQQGALSVDDAMSRLRDLPFADLGYAVVDHHRALRQGAPEVIFGEGKTIEQILGIAQNIVSHGSVCLITRLQDEKAKAIKNVFPDGQYSAMARTAILNQEVIRRKGSGVIAVVAAGTSDLPVAEEACETLTALGREFVRVYDVGVAGIHRVLAKRELFNSAKVILVVAGMEGALPSVVAGLTSKPVIGVPTSIGYGAAFHGVTALCGMLTSCASGLTVVNIDNGFGAAFAAARMDSEPT